jgi:hypothetical protein
MPVVVHCPSPACARVHRVKDKYAGLRGKCPACGAWMFVPAAPAPAAPAAAPAPSVGPPARQPRWAGALLIVLGLASLAGVASTPFLDAGRVVADGDFQADAEHALQGIREESRAGVLAAPAAVAVVALLGLTAGLAGRRFGPFSLSMLHAAALLAAGLFFVAAHAFHAELGQAEAYRQAVARLQAAGARGAAEYHLGAYLFAGLLGAAGAAASFTLAAVVLHRRWWSRAAAFLLLGGAAALAAVWVLRGPLGVGGLADFPS